MDKIFLQRKNGRCLIKNFNPALPKSNFQAKGEPMKRTILFTLAVMLILPTSSLAHRPKNMNISFNENSQQLTVTVFHPTTNSNVHYIYELTIAVNDKPVKTVSLTGSDSTASGLTYNDTLRGVQSGDTLSVTASCSRGGTLRSTIVVK